MAKTMILVSGASGQIGTALTRALRERYGQESVLATDIKKPEEDEGLFEMMDILNVQRMGELIEDYEVTEIYHLAAILSASGEWHPLKTWNVNLNGLLSVLDLAVQKKVSKVFFPSTIAVFGATTPKTATPQDVPLVPTTVYGISKVAGELWCNYYYQRYNLDVRSVRYPGIISYEALPGGGTTDYAVEIFHEAIKNGKYKCFLKADTRLPMLYMPDAIRGTIQLMEAPFDNIRIRYGYNIAEMNFTPAELAGSIKKYIPDFSISYEPDFRQKIAESWSESIDDSKAREDWGWQPAFDLDKMTRDMLSHLSEFYQIPLDTV
jgi:nucleoside-diphosphate-sugar epimerase